MGMVKEGNICNYCLLRDIRQRAEARGRFVRIRPGDPDVEGGVYVYEVPNETKHYDLGLGKADHDTYLVEWFESVTDHCVC